nr:AAA family ATPase [Conexibacter sp. DBS9H8]
MIEGREPGVGGEFLLERDAVLTAIEDAISAVGRGGGESVFVIGTAGIGKTSVLGAAAAAARAQGFRIATAVGSPMEVGLPFGLFSQAVVALGGAAVEDVVRLERLGGQPARFYRTLRWLGELAARTPVFLALDDLHWSDPDSLALLGFLCRRLTTSRVLVLGSLRPESDPASALVQELVVSGHARVVELEALSPQASEALVARIASRPLDAGQGDQLWRACAGTPLLLEAGAWVLNAGGALDVGHGGTLGRAFLLQRFAGVGDEAFGYLHAASIFGVRFAPKVAAALADLDPVAAQAAHMRLVRARLLDDLGAGEAAFVHPLFAQALLESQPLSERERLHAAAFRLLVAAGAPDAVAAAHAAAGRLIGDPLAVQVAARAGRAALGQGALEAACVHLASAAELAQDTADGELLLEYASALAARAQIDAARVVCERLLARPALELGARARALALLGRGAMVAGRPAVAESFFDQAVAAATLAGPAVEAATLADAAVTCHVASPIPWVITITSRALALLGADAPTRPRLEFLSAYSRLMGGDPCGVALLTRETKRWSARTDPSDSGWAWTMAVHSLNTFKLLEDPAGATDLFEREFAAAIEDGAPILINALAGAYADAVHRLGRTREALELVQGAISLSAVPMAPWMDLAQAVLLTELGRDEDARAHFEVLRSFTSGNPPRYYAPVSLWLDLLDARRLLASGEPEHASDTMVHAAEIAELTGWREPCIVPWASVGIEAHLSAGRVDRARALIEDLELLAHPLSCRWPRAVLALGHARIAAAEGRLQEADRRFEAALGIFAELPMPIHHADALISHGVYLRRSGRPREAREPLSLALSLAERTGSERAARLARAELGAAGGRRRRRDRDSTELTAQEQRVAGLAAEGLSNAQIAAVLQLSPRTVGHHLGHVYAKLGVSTRRALIADRTERD